MLLGLTLVDIITIAPGSFVIGLVVGYVIRAKYNGKGDK